MIDKFHDECGVVGVYSPDKTKNISSYLYYGLFALQHRGQESAGIAVNRNGKINIHKNVGLVADVFKGGVLKNLKGNVGVGHVRYSTSGEGGVTNAQPLMVNIKSCDIALAHNGNLIYDQALREMLEDGGVVFQTTIDTEVMVDILARGLRHGVIESIQRMPDSKGGWCMKINVGRSGAAASV